MQAKPIPRWGGVLLLLAIALSFGSNHISARVAFEHGASVTTAVTLRSIFTALFVLALIRLQRIPLALAAGTGGRALLIGCVLAAQSFCLYSAVARIPVALALLAFNTYPLLFVLLSWVVEGERPPRHVGLVVAVALAGLALALDVVGRLDEVAGQWEQIGAGVGFALSAAVTFAVVMVLTNRWLKPVDARLRSMLTMATTALLVTAAGALTDSLALPADGAGWAGLALLTLLYGTGITVLFAVLPRLASPSLTVALNFEPVAALVLAWLLLGQAISPVQVAGALLVVGAIVLLGVLKRPAARR